MEAGVVDGKAVIIFDDEQYLVNSSQRNIQNQDTGTENLVMKSFIE